MTAIRKEHLTQSVADAPQSISCCHPVDSIEALGQAYAAEESPAAKDAVDAGGSSVHESGPREWQQKIGRIPVTTV